jgi:nitronate monooxygenase
MVRRLWSGDSGGHVRRALAAFPIWSVAERVVQKYFRQDGNGGMPSANETELSGDAAESKQSSSRGFKLISLPAARATRERDWLIVLANFVEVYLAKEGHEGVVGINYLHKIQFPTLASIYGAMLAGVEAILMGAGIPGEIPGVLDRLVNNEDVCAPLDVLEAGEQKYRLQFDPKAMWRDETGSEPPALRRPKFLAIVSSATLAKALLKKAPGGIDGFVVEAPIAGGHNAPPRGPLHLSVRGEPIYGERDEVDMGQMAALGVPFWLAGGYATRSKLESALALGAHGIQVGTAFAFCEESGLAPDLRRKFLAAVAAGSGDVFTDPAASPTSFPFKVASLPETLSEPGVYSERTRVCDLGYLRRAYRKDDGTLGYRCPAEPVDDYIRKGGKAEETIGRKCLCNSLMANIGLGQVRQDEYQEPPLLTAGDDLDCILPHISSGHLEYHAKDVIELLMPAK